METHGVKIEKCPRCGKSGLLPERLTVTRNGLKKYTYRKLNIAHYLGNGISKNGKPVDRIHWCYLNADQIKQLQSSGDRQTFTQNVTQTVRQNKNGDLSFFSENNGSPGEIRTPVDGSKARCALAETTKLKLVCRSLVYTEEQSRTWLRISGDISSLNGNTSPWSTFQHFSPDFLTHAFSRFDRIEKKWDDAGDIATRRRFKSVLHRMRLKPLLDCIFLFNRRWILAVLPICS
jgi:hypothetical protein